MSDSYNAPNVKCPFYVKDKPHYIVCEGVCKGTRVNLWFSSEKKRKAYISEHCNQVCTKCHIAKMHEEINKNKLPSRQ